MSNTYEIENSNLIGQYIKYRNFENTLNHINQMNIIPRATNGFEKIF